MQVYRRNVELVDNYFKTTRPTSDRATCFPEFTQGGINTYDDELCGKLLVHRYLICELVATRADFLAGSGARHQKLKYQCFILTIFFTKNMTKC